MDAPQEGRTVLRRANGTTQIPEIAELVQRGLAAGLHVTEDLPDRTPYATCGATIYEPDKRPPATLVVEYTRLGAEAPWTLFAAAVYASRSKTYEFPTSDPAEAEELISHFLETYRRA